MSDQAPGIVIVERKMDPGDLARLVRLYFEDMVKYAVDIERRVAAVGGELHADAEQLLLDSGSRQADVWGSNYFPGKGREACIEFTALINIRPSSPDFSAPPSRTPGKNGVQVSKPVSPWNDLIACGPLPRERFLSPSRTQGRLDRRRIGHTSRIQTPRGRRGRRKDPLGGRGGRKIRAGGTAAWSSKTR